MHRARVALGLSSQYVLDSIWNRDHIPRVAWTVLLHSDFDAELAALDELLQDELLAHGRLLADFGPNLGRPTVDTLKASRHPNMKELRFGWQGGVWRVACRIRIRPTAPGDSAGRGRQRRGGPEAFLSPFDCGGR